MKKKLCLCTGLLVAAAALSAQAGSFFSDFNSGALPTGTHTNAGSLGGAYLELSGGVGDSGCLKITKNINGQNGSLVLDDLDSGNPIYGFDISFNVRIGGGSSPPADGFAVVVAPDLSDSSIWGETGTGSGLRFTWGIYTGSGQTPPDPAIRVRVGGGGTVVAWKGYTVAGMETGGTNASTWWSTVHIRLNTDGTLNYAFKGANVFTNFFIPGYQDFINAGYPVRFGIGGRTGGLNENFWIDNLSITTFTNPAVTVLPTSQVAQKGDDVEFRVAVGYTNGASFQWYSNSVAIPGATGAVLTLTNVPASASGSHYTVTATGPSLVITSSVATLTVKDLAPPSTPQLAFDFNGATVPAAVTLTGTAALDSVGGITNSGCIKLVNPAGSAAMLVNDGQSGASIYGFTARFKILVGGGTVPPADGFAFVCGSDIPDSPSGDFEDGLGLGTGLMVTFDIYNNGSIFGYNDEVPPAPSIDVRLGSQVIASVQLPVSFMETGLNDDGTPAYKDTIIQVNPDATMSVVYHGAVVFDRLAIPAFGSVGPSTNSFGSRFAIAARTGGLNDNIWIDNFELTTVTTPPVTVRITQQPTNQTILVDHAMTNAVAVNDTTGVTYQWCRGATAVTGATNSSYIIPSVATTDNGAVFTVLAAKASVTVTSTPATLTVCNLTAPASPNLTFTFDDGLVPAGAAAYGTGGGGYVTSNGGVGDSGVFHITDSLNGEQGALVISNLYSGAQLGAIAASWDLRMGGGSGNPADGYSFNFAPDLSDSAGGNETGNGSGLSVCWDIYGSWTDASPAPAVNIKYKGTIIASALYAKADIQTGSDFRKVLLRVDSDGKLYLAYGEQVLFNGLQLPNYTFTAAGKFGFYGRTGGENENQWIDNVLIQGTKSSGPLSIITQPASAAVIVGSTATFSVVLSDPTDAAYKWYKNNSLITNANAASYTTPATVLTDNGALFKVVATSPSGTATSSNAVLAVVAPLTISNPLVSYNFDDCAQPDGTTLYGSGQGNGNGGYIADGVVSGNCCLHLTDAAGGEGGTFIIPDLNTNAPVKAFTLHFSLLQGGGTTPPADGFSFVWCSSNDIPAGTIISEEGIGNNLIVSSDIWDNGNETPPAPDIDLRYKGTVIASKQMPWQQLETGTNFGDVVIRVSETGVVDMQYNGMVIFNRVQLPDYTALLGGVFAFGGRTGGSYENQWLDNIQIATTAGLVPVPLSFIQSGSDLRLTWDGGGFVLQATASLSPPVTWTNVPDATSPYFAPLTGLGQYYRLAPAQ